MQCQNCEKLEIRNLQPFPAQIHEIAIRSTATPEPKLVEKKFCTVPWYQVKQHAHRHKNGYTSNTRPVANSEKPVSGICAKLIIIYKPMPSYCRLNMLCGVRSSVTRLDTT